MLCYFAVPDETQNMRIPVLFAGLQTDWTDEVGMLCYFAVSSSYTSK